MHCGLAPGKKPALGLFLQLRHQARNRPAEEIWKILNQRGKAEVSYHLTGEEVPGEKAVHLHAPKSLLEAQPAHREAVRTTLHRLEDEQTRPLHMKAMRIEGGLWAGYMIGSSNFTSAGLGLHGQPNFEANLVYFVQRERADKTYRALVERFPDSKPIVHDADIRWQPREDEGEDSLPEGLAALPAFFGSAVYGREKEGEAFVRFTFDQKPPPSWTIFPGDTDRAFLNADSWTTRGRPRRLQLSWESEAPPSGFTVSWDAAQGIRTAWWPVNVECSDSLPPPEALRGLSLEALLRILTSARPLHDAIRGWLRKTSSGSEIEIPPSVVDPHGRVDTSAFLLQRTRRVSWAIDALRERLERPLPTLQALHWRLRGPVGAGALAVALEKEAASDEERAFLLTELALEIVRSRPREAPGAIDVETVRREITNCAREIRERVESMTLETDCMVEYIEDTFRRVLG
jgi:hypothetical protein